MAFRSFKFEKKYFVALKVFKILLNAKRLFYSIGLVIEYKVKVTIVDMDGKEVWRKTLKNVYLYVFSDGQIQVGKQNFTKILITKNVSGTFNGKIRENEGVY
jgi:hypothetical protein